MTAIPSDLRDWLAANRTTLNARFQHAHRRFGRLDGGEVLDLVRDVLAPLAGTESGTADLLLSVYDLILLHAGRGLLGAASALRLLLTDVFRVLRPTLRQRPRTLPGALSNAVENLGNRGLDFVRALGDLAERIVRPDDLLGVGALLAWRLGDARLRAAALEAGVSLPPALALAALGLTAHDATETPALLARLADNAWFVPGRTLPDFGEGWRLAGSVGGFAGFDGHFAEPPTLLANGNTTRHRFWVQCGADVYRLDADAFGWVCRPDAAVQGTPATPRRKPAAVPKDATSLLTGENWLAFTHSESFRVTVLLKT